MIEFFQEATAQLPRLTQTSLFAKFDEQDGLAQKIRDAVSNKNTYVQPNDMKEIMALIRLNGSAIAKKAVKKFEEGKLVLIYDKDRSKIPAVLPFIVIQNKTGEATAYVFADRVVTNITSSHEYPNLMAAMEAAYLAASLQYKPTQFLLNRQLVLNLCELYTFMWLMPLEQKLYMKGDNLNKAMMYVIAYFYRMIDGDKMSVDSIPFKRMLKDKFSAQVANQIVTEVKMMPDLSYLNLIKLIKQINPVRYENLDATFMTYFTSSCGIPLIFALENLQYLFLLVTSAYYKTKVTAYGLNKTVTEYVRRCISTLSGMDIKY